MTDTVRAVIFDWAGTTVDYGSRAPVAAFIEVFRRNGVAIEEAEARGPMGTAKKEHIRALLAIPGVAARWRDTHGHLPGEAEVGALYEEFIPLQMEAILRHSDVIPGIPALMRELRNRGVRVGSTTGYPSAFMRDLQAIAAAQGFEPEVTVCADQVPQGRPAPWMALKAAQHLQAYPIWACVKVGDTVADVEEGRNAGIWTVAVTRTGNELGLSFEAAEALLPDERSSRLSAASDKLSSAGADYVVEDLSGLMRILDEIEDLLARGARPGASPSARGSAQVPAPRVAAL